MKDQKQIFFGRTMEPCDYETKLANALEEKDCVVIKAYDGKRKNKNKEEEYSK